MKKNFVTTLYMDIFFNKRKMIFFIIIFIHILYGYDFFFNCLNRLEISIIYFISIISSLNEFCTNKGRYDMELLFIYRYIYNFNLK